MVELPGGETPNSGTYDTAVNIGGPYKKGYSFKGWTISGMDSCTHTFGTYSSTDTTKTGCFETSYKNLRSTAGTVTFKAVWEEGVSILRNEWTAVLTKNSNVHTYEDILGVWTHQSDTSNCYFRAISKSKYARDGLKSVTVTYKIFTNSSLGSEGSMPGKGPQFQFGHTGSSTIYTNQMTTPAGEKTVTLKMIDTSDSNVSLDFRLWSADNVSNWSVLVMLRNVTLNYE